MAKCYASKVIEVALKDEGYLEKRSNTDLYDKTKNAGNKNFTKYAYELDQIKDFYNGKKNGFPYCAVAVDYWQVKAFGVENMKKITFHTQLGAGCIWCAKQYEKAGRLYKSAKDGDFYHTGLVYKVDSKYVYTIEANTTDSSSVVANGGATVKKKYPVNSTYIRYGRPKYDAEPKITTIKKTITQVAQEIIAGGIWGNGTERKNKLEKAGYNYDEVQAKVNELIKTKSIKKGDAVVLNNKPLYANATTKKVSKKISGTYYIYDGKKIDGRYRITNSKAKAGKTPIWLYVTGYIEV